jgi:hypothetical protein
MGGRRPQDWCGLAMVPHHPSSAVYNLATVANSRSWEDKNSNRIVLCSRSTFAVVVGEYGAVSK